MPVFEVAKFLGKDSRRHIMAMPSEHSPDTENVDAYRGTLRPRESLYWTNIEGEAQSILKQIHMTLRDGTHRAVWFEADVAADDTNIWYADNPQSYTGTAAGTQLDAALTDISYPLHWQLATNVAGAQLHNVGFFCNGLDAGKAYGDVPGLTKWGLYQPREMVWHAVATPPFTKNGLYVGPGNGRFFFYGGVRFAFTYVNKNYEDEPESNPIEFNMLSPREKNFDGSDFSVPVSYHTAPLAGAKTIYMTFVDPPDPQTTHIRVYRSRTGAKTLKLMAEIEPIGGNWYFFADADVDSDYHKYNDSAILNARNLEYDHNCPPCLAGVTEFREFLFGFMRYPVLESLRSVDATADAAVIGVGLLAPAAGYLIQIEPAVPGTRHTVGEHMVGMTIRFPQGADIPYVIMDVKEDTQQILIGHPIGYPDTVFARMHPDDYAFGSAGAWGPLPFRADFVIEAPRSQLYWSKRGAPFYWPANNYRPIGEDDGEDMLALSVCGNSLIIHKANHTYALSFESSPHPGYGSSLRLLSSAIGISSPEAVVRESADTVLFHHRTGYWRTNGNEIAQVAADRTPTVDTRTCIASTYHRAKRKALFSFTTGFDTIDTLNGDGVFPWRFPRNAQASPGIRIFTAMNEGLDSDGNNQVWLSDSDGNHWYLVELNDAVGQADGHAAAPTVGALEFFPRSQCTADGAAGVIIDANQVFPNAAAGEGKIVGCQVRVVAGTGSGNAGWVTARTSATQISTTIPVSLDASSVYEIGYFDWYYSTPFIRMADSGTLQRAVVSFAPKPFNSGNLWNQRHKKHMWVKMFEGMIHDGSGGYDPKTMSLFESERFDVDEDLDEAFIEPVPELDLWLVNYTNSTYETTSPHSTRGRGDPNTGVASIDNLQHSIHSRIMLGESGVKLSGEVISIGFMHSKGGELDELL